MTRLARSAAPVSTLALFAALAMAAPGCGSGGPEMARVRGTVTVKGQPLTRGTVTFASTDPARTNASGQIGSDGSYDLQTHDPGDGAELGEYVVTVSDVDTSKILDYIPKQGMKVPQQRSLVPAKYGATNTSDLKRTVQRGSNQFDFDLTD
jgi:hypothetical protein